MERTGQQHLNYFPLVRQFALTAVRLQMLGGKTCHVWHPSIRTCFFVLYPHLDATHSNFVIFIFWEKLQILILAKSKNPYKSLKIKKLNTHEILIFLQNLVLPKLSENKIHFTSRAARDTD